MNYLPPNDLGALWWHLQPTPPEPASPIPDLISFKFERATQSHLAQIVLHDACQHRVVHFVGSLSDTLDAKVGTRPADFRLIFWHHVLSLVVPYYQARKVVYSRHPEGTRLTSLSELWVSCYACSSVMSADLYDLARPRT